LGICRTLNVLLGASVVGVAEWSGGVWLYAVAIGLYTIGFSLMAKHEAALEGEIESTVLRDGEVLCFGSFIAVGTGPLIFAQQLGSYIWLFFFIAPIGWWVLSSTRAVVRAPTPRVMRKSVTRLILGFILLDAWISCMAAGPAAGLVVAALFVPAMIASRKVAMT